jgi:hypothetical protein
MVIFFWIRVRFLIFSVRVPVPLNLSALPLRVISSRLDLLLPSSSPRFSLPFWILSHSVFSAISSISVRVLDPESRSTLLSKPVLVSDFGLDQDLARVHFLTGRFWLLSVSEQIPVRVFSHRNFLLPLAFLSSRQGAHSVAAGHRSLLTVSFSFWRLC